MGLVFFFVAPASRRWISGEDDGALVDELLEDLVIQLRRLSNAKLKSPRRSECYPRGSNGNALRHVSTFVQKLYVLVDIGFLICSDSYTLFTAR